MKILISLSKIPLSLVRPYAKGWNKSRYNDLFEKYAHSRKKYRIYLPLKNVVEKQVYIPRLINDSVVSNGYVVDDYLAGIAIMPTNPKKKIKIGKLLYTEAKKIYDNDPQRASVKNQDMWVVISRHPYDIAGMSFDRGWTSCMDLGDNDNTYTSYLDADIALGTLVSYLINAKDKNINSPVARISIKPYACEKDGSKIGLFMGKMYGQGNAAFYKTVHDFCASYNKGLPEGVYKILENLYSDGLQYSAIGESPEAIQKLVQHPYVENTILQKAIDSKDSDTKRKALQNCAITKEMLESAYTDIDPDVKAACANNPNASEKLMLEALTSTNELVKKAVVRNKSATPKVLLEALNDKNFTIRRLAVINQNADDSVLLKGITDKNPTVRECAVEVPTASNAVLLKALDSKSEDIQLAAIKHANAGTLVILKALCSKSVEVRREAADAYNSNEGTLLIALDNDDAVTRQIAVKNANATEAVYKKALSDTDNYVPKSCKRIML